MHFYSISRSLDYKSIIWYFSSNAIIDIEKHAGLIIQ